MGQTEEEEEKTRKDKKKQQDEDFKDANNWKGIYKSQGIIINPQIAGREK